MTRSEQQMLISAVRYAIGRHTYIVGDTVEFVLARIGKLDDGVKDVVLRDLGDYFSGDMSREHDCDVLQWRRLVAALEAAK